MIFNHLIRKPVSSEFTCDALNVLEILTSQYPGKMLVLVIIDDPVSMGTRFTIRMSMPTMVGKLYEKTMAKMKMTITTLWRN